MRKLRSSERERFQEVVATATEWETIDQLVTICDQGDYWTDSFFDQALINAKKFHIRRMIKSLKGDDAFPIWASVEVTNKAGEDIRVYKQERLFDVSDYRQQIRYHADRAGYHQKLIKWLVRRCQARFQVQLELPYPESQADGPA